MLHAAGEEEVIFPAVEKAAPQVAAPYLIDHRELDTMTEGLDAVLRSPNELDAARATAVLTSHLRIHLHKEDTHLYPILRSIWGPDEQAVVVGHMAKKVPPEFMPSLVHWMFPLVSQDDQATMSTVWAALMPPEVFGHIKPLIRDAVTAADLAELTKRVPQLV